jgi:mRNA interferase MazF
MKIKKWGIYRANLDPVIGSEQGKSRPVLIISEDGINDLLKSVNVLPLTSKKEDRIIYPNEVLLSKGHFGLEKDTIVLCHQLRTLDKIRFSNFYGMIEDGSIHNQIIEAIQFQLGV